MVTPIKSTFVKVVGLKLPSWGCIFFKYYFCDNHIHILRITYVISQETVTYLNVSSKADFDITNETFTMFVILYSTTDHR